MGCSDKYGTVEASSLPPRSDEGGVGREVGPLSFEEEVDYNQPRVFAVCALGILAITLGSIFILLQVAPLVASMGLIFFGLMFTTFTFLIIASEFFFYEKKKKSEVSMELEFKYDYDEEKL